jgi:coenzyme F420-reducing hydrogenase delta subunit
VPVLCVAKVEAEHMFRSFEVGAEGVFIAGCGEQCARENTAAWVRQRVEKVRKALGQIGIEPVRLHTFATGTVVDPAKELDKFVEQISGLYLASIIMQEVKR